VVVRAGSRGASDFACLVADPWRHCVFVIFTISMMFFVCVMVVMCGGGVSDEVVVVGERGAVLFRFGWMIMVFWTRIWCRKCLRTRTL